MSTTPEALRLKGLGVEDGALAEFGLGALTRRLDLIGVSLQS
jgi:hypothetical protein